MATSTGSAAIPFNRPMMTGREQQYVAEAIHSGRISGDGPFTFRCARLFESKFGVGKAFMTPSCTAALELAAILCNLEPGDEVILPSYTFVSTASAIVRLGARPVFVEIRPDTLNLDETRIEAAITSRTRAIFPVHYAGVGCDMDAIMAVARRHRLWVVEDAAQAVNATYRGRHLGSIGHLGTYSFHDTKNLVCGEGGTLCVNDPSLRERAEILRDKGTNRAKFFRGEVDKYTWVDVGSSYIPSEIACAFLAAQVEAMDRIKVRRRQIEERYRALLLPLADAGLLRLPVVPGDCEGNSHGFFVVLQTGEERDGLMTHLKELGIGATFHFVPLHLSPMGARYGYRPGDLPITESLAARILRLPAFGDITPDEQGQVAEAIRSYFGQRRLVESVAYPACAIGLGVEEVLG